MKDFRIDGKMKRVFSLKETKDRVVFIPLESLTRKDYDRLTEAEEKAGAAELLTELRNTTADNGRNLLALVDNLIEVGVRDPKEDRVLFRMSKPNQKGNDLPTHVQEQAQKTDVAEAEEKPKPRRRGRPPKKTEETK